MLYPKEMITDLRLQHFRSYRDASFELGPGVNIVVGPNASGKTNLLEAVAVLASSGSWRARDAELVRFGQAWARIDANLPDSSRTVKLETDGVVKKTFVVDEQVLSRLSHQRLIPSVLFEPNHLLLFDGSPDQRRDFLDDLSAQLVPGFAATRRHYRRVLAQRNALLKKNPRGLRDQLFVWNVRLSELGGRVAAERHKLIDEINERISGLYSQLAGRDTHVLAEYISPFLPETYETALLKKLEQNLEQDVLRGFTSCGPHREDLAVKLGGHFVNEAASRGEARSLVLALKIIELSLLEQAHQTKPLLLLDDVFSELDNKRRQALTRLISGHQTFITTTDADMVVRHFTASNVIPITQ